jgi:hypothetical protein
MDRSCNEFISELSKKLECNHKQHEILFSYLHEKNIRIKGNKVELLMKKTGRGRPRKGIESICDKASENYINTGVKGDINDNNLRIVNVNGKNLCDGLGVEYELVTEEYI